MKPTAQAIVWEFYGEAPPVAAARKAFSPMVKFWLHKSQIFLPRWRCSRAEFLRELWTHLTSGRPRSLALGGLHRSLGNTAAYGTQHCQELLQRGAGCRWTEDGIAGAEVLLLLSLSPLQVSASSLTRDSPHPCISANLTKHFLPSNTRDKSYLSHYYPWSPYTVWPQGPD